MPNGDGNGNQQPPTGFIQGVFWLAQKYGLHAAIAACLTAFVCWFYWQGELRNREKDKFIQEKLLGEMSNATATGKELVREISESSDLRREVKSVIDRNSQALDRNSAALDKTQQVLVETQQIIKEKM